MPTVAHVAHDPNTLAVTSVWMATIETIPRVGDFVELDGAFYVAFAVVHTPKGALRASYGGDRDAFAAEMMGRFEDAARLEAALGDGTAVADALEDGTFPAKLAVTVLVAPATDTPLDRMPKG